LQRVSENCSLSRIVRDGQGLHSRVTRRVLTPCMPCGPQMPGATMADLAVYSRPMPWPSYRTHIAATVRRRLGCSVCHKLLTEMTVYIVGGITHGLVATADVGEVHCRPQNEAKIDFRRFRIGSTVLLLAYSSRAMLSSTDSRREKQLALLDES